MNKDLEKKLIDEFPVFFQDMYGDPRKTCMAFGITCENGWYDIINDLCKLIKEYEIPDFKFMQIKEKFGMLTIYSRNGNKSVWNLISIAEKKSLNVCEMCGSEENVKMRNNNNWLRTACDTCNLKKEN